MKVAGVAIHIERTSAIKSRREETTIRSDRNRKRGVAMAPEDFHELGIFNLAYDNENIRISLGEDKGSIKRCHEADLSTLTYRGRSRIVSCADEVKNESETAGEENPTPSHFEVDFEKSLKKRAKSRTVSFANKIQSESETAGEEGNATCDPEPKIVDLTCKPAPKQKSSKTAKDWLVDPHLYKVS